MVSMDSKRLKCVAMIQSVISRMAADLLTSGKWNIAMGGDHWVVRQKGAHTANDAVAIQPACCFWILDVYYLSHERKFRNLYEQACKRSEEPDSFTLKTNWIAKGWIASVVRHADCRL